MSKIEFVFTCPQCEHDHQPDTSEVSLREQQRLLGVSFIVQLNCPQCHKTSEYSIDHEAWSEIWTDKENDMK